MQQLAHAIFVCYLRHAAVISCYFRLLFMAWLMPAILACSGWLMLFSFVVYGMQWLAANAVTFPGNGYIATAPYSRLAIQQ